MRLNLDVRYNPLISKYELVNYKDNANFDTLAIFDDEFEAYRTKDACYRIVTIIMGGKVSV